MRPPVTWNLRARSCRHREIVEIATEVHITQGALTIRRTTGNAHEQEPSGQQIGHDVRCDPGRSPGPDAARALPPRSSAWDSRAPARTDICRLNQATPIFGQAAFDCVKLILASRQDGNIDLPVDITGRDRRESGRGRRHGRRILPLAVSARVARMPHAYLPRPAPIRVGQCR